MNKIKVYLFLILIQCYVSTSCETTKEVKQSSRKNISSYKGSSRIDSQFQFHFKILDSIAQVGFIDSTLRAPESISFMQKNTGIDSEVDANFFGTLFFTENDWKKWHRWYREHRDSLQSVVDP